MAILMSMKHPGICSVCGKDAIVVTFGDDKTRKVAYICEACSKKLKMKTDGFVKKYGKKNEEPFEMPVKIIKGK